jgi:hypothetical protein
MTYHYLGHPPYPPVQRGPNYPKIVFFVALGLLLVVVLITVMVAVRHPKSGSTPAAGGQTGTSAAAAAVCRPGSLREHLSGPHVPTFTGATDVAQCTAKISAFPDAPPGIPANERYGVIWIVQFPSPDTARTEAASKSLLAATAVVPRTGTLLFAAPSDWTGTSLQPLAQFGFQITPTHIR